MSRRRRSYKPPPNKNLEKVKLEDHIDYWEEAQLSRRNYFLNNLDIDVTNIMNWLISNSKYLYDITDLDNLKHMYVDMCDAIISVRLDFNYEKIGKIMDFIITDNRFYIKPFEFPKSLKEIHESYLSLIAKWDPFVLKRFSFPYKTLLAMRYEIQNFLLYLALEGCAQNAVSPSSHFSLDNVLTNVLECLEIPMSLYFDSFHIRKLLFQISKKRVPAYVLHCIHPVISQLHYVFQLYYQGTLDAWKLDEDLKGIPLTLIGFSYLIQNFLIDNYNNMIYWKSEDFTEHLEKIVKPGLISMFDDNMPLDIINRILVQGFYDIIGIDCNHNLVRMQFNLCAKEVSQWQLLVQAWNDKVVFDEFMISKDSIVFLQSLMSTLYCRSIDDWEHALLCVDLIHNFIAEYVKDFEHALVLLKYLCEHHWISDDTLHNQIQSWFQTVLDAEIELGFNDNEDDDSSNNT